MVRISHAQLCAAVNGGARIHNDLLLFRAKQNGHWHTSDPHGGLTGFTAGDDDAHWLPGHYTAIACEQRETASGAKVWYQFFVEDATFEHALANDLDITEEDGRWG